MKKLWIAGYGDIARRAAPAKGRILPVRVVYVSTSGVYGDCRGARIDASRAVHPRTDGAHPGGAA